METEQFSQHISRSFNEELENLRNEVLRMGGMVENHLDIAIEAIVAGDSEMGLAVAGKDHEINQMEVDIDEECSRILATRGPAAADLRLIVAVIKTITDLERVGDEAQKIGYLASHLASGQQAAGHYHELSELGEHVKKMLHDALDAFSRLDVKDALLVVEEDKLVDEEYDMVRLSLGEMLEGGGFIFVGLNEGMCHGSVHRNAELYSCQHCGGSGESGQVARPGRQEPGLGPMRAPEAEVHKRLPLRNKNRTGGFRGDEGLKMQKVDQPRLDKLRLANRSSDSHDRFMRKKNRTFRHRVKITGKAEFLQRINKFPAEPSAVREPVEFSLRKLNTLEKLYDLFQTRRHQKSPVSRHVTDEKLKYRSVLHPLLKIPLQHGELIQVGQQKTGLHVTVPRRSSL